VLAGIAVEKLSMAVMVLMVVPALAAEVSVMVLAVLTTHELLEA
jgi:hypothetical protein